MWQTDGRTEKWTDGQRATAEMALTHSVALKWDWIWCDYDFGWRWRWQRGKVGGHGLHSLRKYVINCITNSRTSLDTVGYECKHSDNRWSHTFSLPISTFSAVGAFHVMRYINVRYLLTYLLIFFSSCRLLVVTMPDIWLLVNRPIVCKDRTSILNNSAQQNQRVARSEV